MSSQGAVAVGLADLSELSLLPCPHFVLALNPVTSMPINPEGRIEQEQKTTPVGFEPTQGDPIGLAGRRLSHSAKVSC